MKVIKQSHLREVFLKYGISEGIFDIFNKKRKQLKNKIKNLDVELTAIINSAPTDEDRKQLRKMSDLFKAASASAKYL